MFKSSAKDLSLEIFGFTMWANTRLEHNGMIQAAHKVPLNVFALNFGVWRRRAGSTTTTYTRITSESWPVIGGDDRLWWPTVMADCDGRLWWPTIRVLWLPARGPASNFGGSGTTSLCGSGTSLCGSRHRLRTADQWDESRATTIIPCHHTTLPYRRSLYESTIPCTGIGVQTQGVEYSCCWLIRVVLPITRVPPATWLSW